MNINESLADQQIRSFFYRNQRSLSLYQAFEERLFELFPDSLRRVQKTQISFYNRHFFACASLMRVLPKSEMPDPYLVITLGLPYALNSQRVAVKCEPYPGRWTTHIVIGGAEEIDDQLLGWLKEAYEFAERK